MVRLPRFVALQLNCLEARFSACVASLSEIRFHWPPSTNSVWLDLPHALYRSMVGQ